MNEKNVFIEAKKKFKVIDNRLLNYNYNHSLHIHTSNNADALLNPEKFGIGKETIFTILSCNLFKLAPLDLFHDILLPISSG